MIDRFQRINNYFQDKLAKDDKRIYASNFDSQFNNIAHYLDNIVKPAIDNLTNEVARGVAGNMGAYLHNVGDTTTNWQQINSDKLDDYSISFNKLVKHNWGSILISEANGNVGVASSTSEHQVLTSREFDTPTWKKITANNIADKTLTGNQFGILSMENFVEDQFITNIVPNIIDTVNIKNQNITNDKLQSNIITSDKLGIFSNLPVVTNGFALKNIDDGAIDGSKLVDNSIPVNNPWNSYNGSLWSFYGDSEDIPLMQQNHFHQILKSKHIIDLSIEDTDLPVVPDYFPSTDETIVKENSKALFKDVLLGFQFTARHFALDKLTKTYFDHEVQSAIDRLKL